MNKKIEELKKRMNCLDGNINNIMSCLEIIENSLFFASERSDKDMTKPCAAGVEMVRVMLEDCLDEIIDIADSFEELETKEA